MTVNELSREQLIELKGHYLMFDKNGEQDVSYDDIINADTLVSDETVKEFYQNFSFTEDDFSCKTYIRQEEANNLMIDKLNKEDFGDRIYEFAQSLFDGYVNYIDNFYGLVVDDNGNEFDGSEEAWYDDIREDFFQLVYDKTLQFLSKK